MLLSKAFVLKTYTVIPNSNELLQRHTEQIFKYQISENLSLLAMLVEAL